MNSIVQRFIRDDLSREQGWRIIDWCIERGGDEFSFQLMGLAVSHSLHEPLTNSLKSFHRGTPQRENMTTLAGKPTRRATETWTLSRESAGVLRHQIANGLFTGPSYSADGWIEDFTIYRRGEVMLGVITHEGFVVVRLTEQEHEEFSELKIESHETAA
jgi:hypothetical protein